MPVDYVLSRRAKEIAENHVLVHQDSLVNALFDSGFFDYENAENGYKPIDESDLKLNYPEKWALWVSTPLDRMPIDELERLTPEQHEVRRWWRWQEPGKDTFAHWLVSEMDVDWSDVFKRVEIFEWYVVSDWLLHKLRTRGEVILSNDFGEWWGRADFGQALLLDSVIMSIAEEELNES